MATGNLLLGLGRRSIGDITLYRTRGQQRARARVREVANPRTMKQLATRAIMSNVSQLYSLGRSIFDHSFEGYPVGQENQLRFQKVNIARLRSLVNSDIEQELPPEGSPQSRIGVRGVSNGVPFAGLQISEGSLVQDVFTFNAVDDVTSFDFMSLDAEDTTVAKFINRRGFKNNDIFTFVAFCANHKGNTLVDYSDSSTPVGNENYYQMYQTEFYYLQLRVPANAETDTTAITANVKFSDIFEVYGANQSAEVPLGGRSIDGNEGIKWTDVITGIGTSGTEWQDYPGCWGCIRSRFNTDLRSTSFLEWQNEDYGLSPFFLERAWGDSAGLQTSPSLILPGENF